MDSHLSGQHDPVELLYRLISRLDDERTVESTHQPFRSLFSFTLEDAKTCSCGTVIGARESPIEDSCLRIYPNAVNAPDHLQNLVLSNGMATAFSDTCTRCGSVSASPSEGMIRSLGNLLAINVVWSGVDSQEPVARFQIPPHLSLPEKAPVSLRLVGLVWRTGQTADQGHYGCIVSHQDQWWSISNENTTMATSLHISAWQGHLPTLILYERYESVAMPVPKGTLDVRGRS